MSEIETSRSASGKSVEAALDKFSAGLERARTRRIGSILFRLTGENGGDFHVHSTSTGCSVSREAAGPPLIEVMGDADRIGAILDGSKEGRLQFYAGGICVRGDLHYLSELAYELGLVKERF
jgi:hypothetical protein